MKIGKSTVPRSGICTSNEDTIVVRGNDLARDLIGQVNFGDYFYLLLTGKRPDPAASQVLNNTGLSNMLGSTTKATTNLSRRILIRTRIRGATWYHQVTQQPPHLPALTASRSLF